MRTLLREYTIIKSKLSIISSDQAKVFFIKNSAKVKGAAVYISTLSACLWYEKYPFYSAQRAIRWNNTFEYRGNFIHPTKKFNPLKGPEYDIATDTHHFQSEGNDATEIKVGWSFFSMKNCSGVGGGKVERDVFQTIKKPLGMG